MDEVVEVEFLGGPLDGERRLFALADLNSGNGELWVSQEWHRPFALQSSGEYDKRYVFVRKSRDGLAYRYTGELDWSNE